MRRLVLVGVVVAVVASASTASADAGLGVGPNRQLVRPGENAVAWVSNPGDDPVVVHLDPDHPQGITTDVGYFRLDPHSQKNVTIFVNERDVPCRLVTLTWNVTTGIKKVSNGQQVNIAGAVAQELVIQGTSTLEECETVLPQPPVQTNTTTPFPWWLVVAAGACVGAIGTVLWRGSRQPKVKQRSYGF